MPQVFKSPGALADNILQEKVWNHPQSKLDYFKAHQNDAFKDYNIEKVSIDDLIRDNDLNNPVALNNHPETWSPTQSEDDIHPERFEYKADLDNRPSEVINATRFPGGRIRLNDGRHRVRALKNGGYTHVNIPIYNQK